MDLFRNAIVVYATSLISFPINLLTSVVLARFLSVDDRGLYSVALSFAVLATLLSEVGWGPATIYRLRRMRAFAKGPASSSTNSG